jgi:hypothetical protein
MIGFFLQAMPAIFRLSLPDLTVPFSDKNQKLLKFPILIYFALLCGNTTPLRKKRQCKTSKKTYLLSANVDFYTERYVIVFTTAKHNSFSLNTVIVFITAKQQFYH